jgi:hypothetical protein
VDGRFPGFTRGRARFDGALHVGKSHVFQV